MVTLTGKVWEARLKAWIACLASEGKIIRTTETRLKQNRNTANIKAVVEGMKEGEERREKLIESLQAQVTVADATRVDQHSHRVCVVRPEARASLLAYGFLHGKRYRDIEPVTNPLHPEPNWARIVDIVTRFSVLPASGKHEINEWVKEAQIARGTVETAEVLTNLAEPPAVT